MASSGGGDNGTSSYLVATRGYWLLVEDHLEEKKNLLWILPTSGG